MREWLWIWRQMFANHHAMLCRCARRVCALLSPVNPQFWQALRSEGLCASWRLYDLMRQLLEDGCHTASWRQWKLLGRDAFRILCEAAATHRGD